MNPLFLLAPVLTPVLGGLVLIRLHPKTEGSRRALSLSVVCLTSILVWISLAFVSREPVEVYSFTRGFSIDFRLDGPSMLFSGMISVMWPLAMLYAFDYMEHTKRKNLFFGFYVMTYGVTLGIAFASNMTTLYVFFEMLTLVTIPLVTYYADHDSMFAALKYAAYTIGGSSLAFFAVVMTTLFGDAGNFTFGGSVHGQMDMTIMQLAFLFGFFGFGTKAAVFPFYGWLPTASAAPTPVTALLHAVAVVNAGVFAVIRLVWYTYGPELLKGTLCWRIALLTAIFTLVYAAALAVKERHFKRRLACSTVSNLSYMLFGVLLLTPYGYQAGLLHMLFHSIMKMTLFLCAGAFMHQTGRSYVYEINGVGKRMPVTFAMYTLSALSLTGIPALCGFVSKWHLIMAGMEEGGTLALIGVAALIVSAFLCAIYTISVSIRAFFPITGTDRYSMQDNEEELSAGEAAAKDSKDGQVSGKAAGKGGKGRQSAGAAMEQVQEAGWHMLVPIVFFALLNLVFGVWPGAVTELMGQIAGGLL